MQEGKTTTYAVVFLLYTETIVIIGEYSIPILKETKPAVNSFCTV